MKVKKNKYLNFFSPFMVNFIKYFCLVKNVLSNYYKALKIKTNTFLP